MNTIKTLATLTVLGALAAGCAAAPADGTVANNDDGVICRNEHTIGSNMPRKVCRTKAERDAVARETKEEITNRQRSEPISADGGVASPGN